jgi:hypothetical protein
MQIDAFGRLLDTEAPETVDCTACGGTAEYLSSAWQGKGVAYHNYQCRDDGCPTGGTIVTHESTENRRVGPVFRAPRTHEPVRRDDHPADVVVRADYDHEREQAAEAREVQA